MLNFEYYLTAKEAFGEFKADIFCLAYPYRGSTTPLHLASRNNHLDCMRVLFDAGADYNAVDEDGRTSLYMAAERALESAVLFHLENSYGRTLLSIPLKDTGKTLVSVTRRYFRNY